ncbi:MAG: T9SS type A sorting domain-containing protein [Bacteroidota bacterium]|nr:T9SS type A sorting domain-containing protein [Bacteroidota bacterium]
MKKITLFFTAILFYAIAFAQSPQLQWSKTYGGSEDDYAMEIVVCTEGYLIAGHTKSYGHANDNYDVYLIRIDGQGNVLWTKTYGGSQDELVAKCEQTHNGGFIISGVTQSWGLGGSDGYILRVDANGDSLWSKNYGGETWDQFYCGIPTLKGGYAFAGYSSVYMKGDQFYFVKTEGDGDSSWTYTVGGDNQDYGIYMRQNDDQSYITVGHTWSEGDESQVYLVMTDKDGGWNWTKAFGGPLEEYAIWMDVTDDPGYVIVGSTQSYGHGSSDFWLVNTDNEGTPMDTYTFGGGSSETANGASRDVDGGILIAGDTWSFGVQAPDVFIMKVTEDGDSIWSLTWGDEDWEYAYEIKPTLDGGYIAVCREYSVTTGDNNILVLKYGNQPLLNSVIYERHGLNKPIKDWQQTFDTITIDIPEDAEIQGMVLYLDSIIHPRLKDVYISIYHLNRLYRYVGSPVGGGANFINTVLHPAASIISHAGQGPFTGVYRPSLSLGGFAMNPNPNEYILYIDDTGLNGHEGTLYGWRLQVFYEGAIGIADAPEVEKSVLEIYPNPCADAVRLRLTNNEQRITICDLFDIEGRKVRELVNGEMMPETYEVEVDVSGLPAGVYFIRVQAGNDVAVQKLLVVE